MEVTDAFIDIAGNHIHYLTAGQSGPVAVLLHGGGIDSARLSWELLISELAATHRVIAPDFPGFGESDKPDALYSVDYYVRFLADFLRAMKIEKASLAGISMGGSVALGFTLENPACVDKLALVDSYGLQREAPMHKLSYLFVRLPGINALSWAMMRSRSAVRASLKSLLRRPGSLTEELVDQAMTEVLRPGAGRAWMAFQKSEMLWSGTRTSYMNRLREIHVPVLVVHGTKDNLAPQEASQEAHVRIRGSRLHWVDGAGHWPQRDHPKEFNRALIRFFNEPAEDTLGLK